MSAISTCGYVRYATKTSDSDTIRAVTLAWRSRLETRGTSEPMRCRTRSAGAHHDRDLVLLALVVGALGPVLGVLAVHHALQHGLGLVQRDLRLQVEAGVGRHDAGGRRVSMSRPLKHPPSALFSSRDG